jgi:protein-L-isoaspartate(D-aspartate) O-methyltransferase
MNKEKQRLLDEVEREAAATAHYTGRKKFSRQVMDAMAEVPREQFVPDGYQDYAYDNGPLPIGYGQTISQPYIVALMTDLLELTKDSKVLEIGTGSGYQAAILSRLAGEVYTVETIRELADSASTRLGNLGYGNIHTRYGDGCIGWVEQGPFDAIIVTAAASHIPSVLLDQLKPGGRMVIPVGQPYMYQELMLVSKDEDGTTHTRSILGVAFVPLVMKDTHKDLE